MRTIQNRFGYEEDPIGLKLLGHRWYDSFSGSFLTRGSGHEGRYWYEYAGDGPLGNVDPSGLLIVVRGDDSGVALFGLGFVLDQPLGGKRMVRPTKAALIAALIAADDGEDFYYWGHGAGGGKIWLNEHETLTPKDLIYIAARRALRGKSRLGNADLHACDTADSSLAVNSWLWAFRSVDGFPGLTAGGWAPRINPIRHFDSPIHYNPGRAGPEKAKGLK